MAEHVFTPISYIKSYRRTNVSERAMWRRNMQKIKQLIV